jgi:hypothetical protein
MPGRLQRPALLALVGLWFALPHAAYAWNDAGHKTVALLAYRDLPDGVKAQMVKLLEKHPHFKCFLDAQRPQGVDRNEWIVARAATWPDFVRPPYTKNPCTKVPGKHPKQYHHPDWHFIDKPFVPKGQTGLDENDLQPKGDTAVSALKARLAELKNGELDEETRAIALCWILHLIGDIHQPLHAAKQYSDQFPLPDGDRGGNFFFVPNRRHAPNLHHYWDSLLGEVPDFNSIDLVVEKIRRTPRFSRERFKDALQKADFADWADESHAAAVKYAYRNGDLKGVNNKHHQPGERVQAMSETYEMDALEVGFLRGALAGFRLRDQLSEVFGK